MLIPIYSKQFKKDLTRILKVHKNKEKIKEILRKLIVQDKLEQIYKDHKLIENYANRRECHIEPDLLLIYMVDNETIIFERIGSHSDLFK